MHEALKNEGKAVEAPLASRNEPKRHCVLSVLSSPCADVVWLFALVSVVPLFHLSTTQNPDNLPKLCVLFVLALFAFFRLVLAPIRNVANRFFILGLLAVCGLTLCLSTATSVDRITSVWGTYSRFDGALAKLFYLAIAGYISCLILPRNFHKAFWFLLTLVAVIEVFVGLLQFFGIDYLDRFKRGIRMRPVGTIGVTNAFAGYLAIVLPGTAALFLRVKSRFGAVMVGVAYVIIVEGLLLSYTRGAWLAAGLGVAWVFLCSYRRAHFTRNILTLILLTWIAFPINKEVNLLASSVKEKTPDLTAISQSSLGERVASSFSSEDTTIRSRFELWKIAIQIWQRHPALGSGPETYQYYQGTFRSAEETLKYGSGAFAEHAHCEPLQLLATLGILGSAPFLFLWSLTFFVAARRCLWDRHCIHLGSALFGAWISAMVFMMSNVHTVSGNVLFWVLTGLLWNPDYCLQKREGRSFQAKQPGTLPYGLLMPLLVVSLGTELLLRPLVGDALLFRATREYKNPKQKMSDYQRAHATFREGLTIQQFLIGSVNALTAKDDLGELLAQVKGMSDRRLASSPADYRVRFMRAGTEFLWAQNGRPELLSEAEFDVRALLEVVPTHLEGSLLLVKILIEKKSDQEALTFIDGCMQWTGGLDYLKKRLQESVLNQGSSRDCDLLTYLARLKGNILSRQGARGEAEKQFRDLLEANPKDGAAYYNLGVLCAEDERYEEAASLFEQAIKLTPDNEDAKWNLKQIRGMR